MSWCFFTTAEKRRIVQKIDDQKGSASMPLQTKQDSSQPIQAMEGDLWKESLSLKTIVCTVIPSWMAFNNTAPHDRATELVRRTNLCWSVHHHSNAHCPSQQDRQWLPKSAQTHCIDWILVCNNILSTGKWHTNHNGCHKRLWILHRNSFVLFIT